MITGVIQFLVIGYLFFVQVLHLAPDMGHTSDPFSWMMASAFMAAISIGWSSAFHVAANSTSGFARVAAVVTMPFIFWHGDLMSVDASVRAFAKSKYELVNTEQMGVGGVSRHNLLNATSVALEQKVLNGASEHEIEAARSRQQQAQADYDRHKNDQQESASVKAMKVGNEDKSTDEIVSDNASRKAWSLEILFNVMCVLFGLRLMKGGSNLGGIMSGAKEAASGLINSAGKSSSNGPVPIKKQPGATR